MWLGISGSIKRGQRQRQEGKLKNMRYEWRPKMKNEQSGKTKGDEETDGNSNK